jgi:hypothetical protein
VVRVKGWLAWERVTGKATAGLAAPGWLGSAGSLDPDAGATEEATGEGAVCKDGDGG